MPNRKHVFALVLILFISPCHARKKNVEKYWKPSRIITSGLNRGPAFSNSEILNLQRVIKSENQRLEKDPFLLQAVFNSSQEVSKAALLALSRVGDSYSIETLSRVLNSKNDERKQIAAFCLGQIGDELSIRLLSQHVTMEKKLEIRAAFYRSMGYSRNLLALPTLEKALENETSPTLLKSIAEGLGILLSGNSADWTVSESSLKRLTALSREPAPLGISASFALSQYKGAPQKLPSSLIMSVLSKSSSLTTQNFLIRTLAKIEDPQVTTVLLSKTAITNLSQLESKLSKP